MFIEGLAVLKIATVMTGLGLTTTIVKDINNTEWGKGLLSKLSIVKTKSSFDLGNEHATVMGMTQYGKTYATLKTLEGLKEGVLFFNPQLTKTPKTFLKADKRNSVSNILEGVSVGEKIDYHTSSDIEEMSKEIGLIISKLYDMGRMDCRIVLDECHLLSLTKDKTGLSAGKRLASTGLSRGFKTVFISQRPATVDNSFYTQSTKHVCFALGLNDYHYLKGLGFPADEMKRLVNGRKYIFTEFDQMNLKGAFTIK